MPNTVSKALADDKRQNIGDVLHNLGRALAFKIGLVLLDDATESFTRLASNSNSEVSEVKVKSDVVFVTRMKPKSERLKWKRVCVYSILVH